MPDLWCTQHSSWTSRCCRCHPLHSHPTLLHLLSSTLKTSLQRIERGPLARRKSSSRRHQAAPGPRHAVSQAGFHRPCVGDPAWNMVHVPLPAFHCAASAGFLRSNSRAHQSRACSDGAAAALHASVRAAAGGGHAEALLPGAARPESGAQVGAVPRQVRSPTGAPPRSRLRPHGEVPLTRLASQATVPAPPRPGSADQVRSKGLHEYQGFQGFKGRHCEPRAVVVKLRELQ